MRSVPRSFVLAAGVLAALVVSAPLLTVQAWPQAWPQRPVKFVVTLGPG
jgi:tripartite-type tricarboxylate transporter receptor subunit TctC